MSIERTNAETRELEPEEPGYVPPKMSQRRLDTIAASVQADADTAQPIDLDEAAKLAGVNVDDIINRMRAQPGGTLEAKVQVTRKGAWKTIAVDGWPAADSRERGQVEFFCWGPGFTRVEILDFLPADERPGFERAPCFCSEGGVWPEVTHYLPVERPAAPAVENWTLVFKDVRV